MPDLRRRGKAAVEQMLSASLPGYACRARPAQAYRSTPVEDLLSYPDFFGVLSHPRADHDPVTHALNRTARKAHLRATARRCPPDRKRSSSQATTAWVIEAGAGGALQAGVERGEQAAYPVGGAGGLGGEVLRVRAGRRPGADLGVEAVLAHPRYADLPPATCPTRAARLRPRHHRRKWMDRGSTSNRRSPMSCASPYRYTESVASARASAGSAPCTRWRRPVHPTPHRVHGTHLVSSRRAFRDQAGPLAEVASRRR